jgi:hypothetical protein
MTINELVILKECLEETMWKGFTRRSSSLVAAPVFFSKEPHRRIQFCIDHQDIHRKTIKK